MFKHPILLFFIIFASSAIAQLNNSSSAKSFTGHLYVSIDDGVVVYLNGEQILDTMGDTRTDEPITLNENDRIVVKLKNLKEGHRFFIAVLGLDGRKAMSFRANDFRVISDHTVVDFSSDDFEKWTQRPRRENLPNPFLFLNSSQAFWGRQEACSLGCLITSQMIPKS